MKLRSLVGLVLPLVIGAGCYSHQAAMARNPVVIAPVSESPAVRVYPVAPSSTTSPSDMQTAMGIRNAIEANPALKAALINADIEVNGGAVTLRGTVPTANDRETLRELVSKYPGVRSVEDDLGVELR